MNKKQKGFSLTELLTVLATILIIAAIAISATWCGIAPLGGLRNRGGFCTRPRSKRVGRLLLAKISAPS